MKAIRLLVTSAAVGASLLAAIPAFAASSVAGKIIVIDPGHGGRDPGAVANGFREKDTTLAVATDLKTLLQAQGAQVIMTRTSDVALGATTDDDLAARVHAAQQAHANAFISVHENEDADPGIAGVTDFYGPACGFYSNLSNSPADVGHSYSLATTVRKAIVAQTGEKDRGTEDMAFWVLGNPGIPAILVETGFISNSNEATKLANPAYQQTMAKAIDQGFVDYFGGPDAAGSPKAPAEALAGCGPSTSAAPVPAPSAAPKPVETWVQTFVTVPLLSGADPNAQQFTTLPPFSYLKVLGSKGSYLNVLNPQTNGPGFVDGAKVGPSGPPPPPAPVPVFSPFWVQNFAPTQGWSGADSKAVSFGPLPLWSYLQVLAPASGPRFQVRVASTNGIAFVDQAAVGPSDGPPNGQPTASPPDQPAAQQVVVRQGDTLFSLSERFGVSQADFVAANHLSDDGKIMVGQTLVVPGSSADAAPAAPAPAAASPAPAAPASPAPAPAPPSQSAPAQQVTIQKGDTLSGIASRYGASVRALLSLNHLASADDIVAGESLTLPGSAAAAAPASTPAAKGKQLVVQDGDSLSAIAHRIGASVAQLVSMNQLDSADAIQAGQTLLVPA